VNFYLKYNFEYKQLYEIIQRGKKKKVNFFIDLQSICTGFYNRDVVLMEVGRYVTDGQISDILLTEYRNYLINLWKRFKDYDPYFITFFDDGRCLQNRALDKDYKNKNSMDNMQVEVENIQLFRTIKKYYFQKIYEQYNKKPDVSKAFYLREYEADCIPHYCLQENLFDSQDTDVVNFILSKDKDLLQTCKFEGTYQIVSGFKTSKANRGYWSRVFGKDDCIEYVYPNFKRGLLDARHISLILAIMGDKSDVINGINGVGPAKAIKLIQDYNLPTTLNELERLKTLPQILLDDLPDNKQTSKIKTNFDQVLFNFKLTDFEEQIKRIPMENF